MNDRGEIDMVAAGDLLQSSASRLARWVLSQPEGSAVPYEVHMAALEACDGVERWSEARTSSKGLAA